MGHEWRWWMVEGAATGLAVGSTLVVLGALAVGSWRPTGLPAPYWVELGGLRTDTLGVICFVLATLACVVSESLRLSRPTTRRSKAGGRSPAGWPHVVVLAAARALTGGAALTVAYISVNAVTHPWSLPLPATHLEMWPTESTLRVVALAVVTGAAAVARTERIVVTGGVRD